MPKKINIKKEIEKIYKDTIHHKELPIAYKEGMAIFKRQLVYFIFANFCVKGNYSDEIPTTWLDPLLTGKRKVIGEPPYNCKDIEKLLFALKKQIQEKEKLSIKA